MTAPMFDSQDYTLNPKAVKKAKRRKGRIVLFGTLGFLVLITIIAIAASGSSRTAGGAPSKAPSVDAVARDHAQTAAQVKQVFDTISSEYADSGNLDAQTQYDNAIANQDRLVALSQNWSTESTTPSKDDAAGLDAIEKAEAAMKDMAALDAENGVDMPLWTRSMTEWSAAVNEWNTVAAAHFPSDGVS